MLLTGFQDPIGSLSSRNADFWWRFWNAYHARGGKVKMAWQKGHVSDAMVMDKPTSRIEELAEHHQRIAPIHGS